MDARAEVMDRPSWRGGALDLGEGGLDKYFWKGKGKGRLGREDLCM
jgi:hypothetical protein